MARHFRRTVNKEDADPICVYCRSVDRFDPANNRKYVHAHCRDVRRCDGVVMGDSGTVGELRRVA